MRGGDEIPPAPHPPPIMGVWKTAWRVIATFSTAVVASGVMADGETNLLSVRAAAQRLGVHENTLRSYESKGVIAAQRLPGSRFRRFRVEDIDSLRIELSGGPQVGEEGEPVYPSLRAFHESDPRRELSEEVCLGFDWRGDERDLDRLRWHHRGGPPALFRLGWVLFTGELYATVWNRATQLTPVVVLGTFPTRDAVETVLDGWEWACRGFTSLAWVRERVRHQGLPRLDEDGYIGHVAGSRPLVTVVREGRRFHLAAADYTSEGELKRREATPSDRARHEWGYGGTGPGNLAEDILADHLGRKPGWEAVGDFVRVVASFEQGRPFVLPSSTVAAWVAAHYPPHRRRADQCDQLRAALQDAQWRAELLPLEIERLASPEPGLVGYRARPSANESEAAPPQDGTDDHPQRA